MIETYKNLREILPSAQRRQAIWLFVMMTIMGLMETVGVASIIPFMAVVADPKVLHSGGRLGNLYTWVGVDNERQFLILLGLLVFAVLVFGNVVKALTTWMIQRFTFMTGHVLADRLVAVYLAKPYAYFLGRHSADLGKNILAEVIHVVTGVLQPALIGVSRCVVTIFLFALIVVIDPVLAVTSITVIGGCYAIFYAVIRRYISLIAHDRVEANRARYHVTIEAFSGIKEIKLRGLEAAYLKRFAIPSLELARTQVSSQSLALLPRYGLESIAFGGVIGIVLYLLQSHEGVAGALPLISLYAFAGYRMLPNLQEIFASAARVRYSLPALSLLHRDLAVKVVEETPRSTVLPLPFSRDIQLSRVSYRYPTSEKDILHDVSLTIPRGTRVGFVGPTGAGKSTVIDVMLGLLTPTTGDVLIDGQRLDSECTIRRWQCQIGYVPQHIFLADDTIAANIAFGSPDGADRALIESAARVAQLHDYIINELPQGYDTPVGERGIRLSGGQRQRLGLARALYGGPAVLVLDEATSALDTETEDDVMAALGDIGRECTVIMIAHRVSTLRRCDTLFKLEKGRITAFGAYEDVVGLQAVANA